MSSRPDPADLEGFIEDSFFLDRMMPGSRERLIRFYETHRERIEYAMNEDYDPETMSWRDWRNSYWDCLPKPPLEELAMSDEEIRKVERDALAGDPQARHKLTTLRLRRRSGFVWLWIEVPLSAPLNIGGPPLPVPVAVPPPGTVELTVHGYATGGEMVLDGRPQPPATPKRGWALACLSVEAGILGREEFPKSEYVSGPHLLDVESFRLVHFSHTEQVLVGEPGAQEP